MPHLTIAYFTSRKEPMFDWFFLGLDRQLTGNYEEIRVVIVDFWAQAMPSEGWTTTDVEVRRSATFSAFQGPSDQLFHVAPKPTVWQGPARLTKENWWAASNARNTAICLAPDGWIAFVDDLSVFDKDWFTEVQLAMEGDPQIITLGSYEKVKALQVAGGDVLSCKSFKGGMDSRIQHCATNGPRSCGGEWLFGCSLLAPVQAWLDVNGFDEACDGLSFEDVIAGVRLENAGYKFQYRPRMKTFESEERHHGEGACFKRSDYGVSPKDKSHAILEIARASKRAPNWFGDEGIAGLREKILQGRKFPRVSIPDREWFTGKPLAEL